MTRPAFRSIIAWHFLVVLAAMMAFCAYHHTMDPSSVSTLATATAGTQGSSFDTSISGGAAAAGQVLSAASLSAHLVDVGLRHAGD